MHATIIKLEEQEQKLNGITKKQNQKPKHATISGHPLKSSKQLGPLVRGNNTHLTHFPVPRQLGWAQRSPVRARASRRRDGVELCRRLDGSLGETYIRYVFFFFFFLQLLWALLKTTTCRFWRAKLEVWSLIRHVRRTWVEFRSFRRKNLTGG
jgi:hypothetical protein